VTSDHEGEGDDFLHVSEMEIGSTVLRDAQQVPESLAATATVSSFSLGVSGPLSKKVRTKVVCHHLSSTCVWNVVGLFCSLPLLVLELGIRQFFEQEMHFRSSELSPFSSPTRAP
jgi:hypothetical protein